MGKSTISMVIFHSYVSLPECNSPKKCPGVLNKPSTEGQKLAIRVWLSGHLHLWKLGESENVYLAASIFT